MQHCGQRKRDGLAGSRLGDSDHIATTESHGPRLALDRSRRREALGADGAHDVLGEADLIKGGDGARHVAALHLHLLRPSELLDFAVGAGRDALVLDVEVLLKVGQLLRRPVDGAKATTKVAHAVVVVVSAATTPSSTSAATAVTTVATTVATTAAAAVSTTVTAAVALERTVSVADGKRKRGETDHDEEEKRIKSRERLWERAGRRRDGREKDGGRKGDGGRRERESEEESRLAPATSLDKRLLRIAKSHPRLCQHPGASPPPARTGQAPARRR